MGTLDIRDKLIKKYWIEIDEEHKIIKIYKDIITDDFILLKKLYPGYEMRVNI